MLKEHFRCVEPIINLVRATYQALEGLFSLALPGHATASPQSRPSGALRFSVE